MKAKLATAILFGTVATAINAAAATLPRVQTENGVAFMTGGVGHDEAAAMKAEEKHYPVSLVFSAGKHNEYLADVKLVIKNKAGKDILTTDAGPITLVKLPAGTYTVSADLHGKKLHRTVQVGSGGNTLISLHWPSTQS